MEDLSKKAPCPDQYGDHSIGSPGFARSGLVLSLLFAALSAFLLWGAASSKTAPPESPHGDLDLECIVCHSTESWSPARISSEFDHAKYGFELTGSHAQAPCQSCHVSLEFKKMEASCTDCHRDVHDGEFGMDCAACHSSRSFNDRAEMERQHQLSRFPLFGAHSTLDCESCHSGGGGNLSFVNQSTECIACHRPDFESTTNPDHVRGGFSEDCSACHGSTVWNAVDFDHNATGFPLTGGHRDVPCESCHIGGNFENASPLCQSCHQTDYDNTTDPDHFAAGYPLDCQNCHGTATWAGASFDHSTTDFPLTGAHITAQCMSCHADGVYNGKPTQCAACHQTDYDNTTDPDHFASGFSMNCESCHNTTAWEGATFDHNTTDFPLTGAHIVAQCLSCHGDGVYDGRPTQCAACHQTDYDNTTDPDHFAAGYPLDCQNCHGTATWAGASFDHNTTDFPLTGAHITAQCMSCHADGVYNGKPTQCAACHQTDYDNTTDPDHFAAGFPLDCESCHNTATWEGATFDHDGLYFSIYSGRHGGLWSDCAECHFNPQSYAEFTCFNCHPHSDQNKTDGDHAGRAGYAYDSYVCYSCHPTGNR